MNVGVKGQNVLVLWRLFGLLVRENRVIGHYVLLEG